MEQTKIALLLNRIEWLAGQRTYNPDEVRAAVHAAIRRLENYLDGEGK